MSRSRLPHVYVLSTGGTIAAKPVSPTQTTGYTSFAFDARALVDAIPGIEERVHITAEQIFAMGSCMLGDGELLRLAARLNEVLARDDVDGAVLTHGTDTMEETAFFLNLTVRSRKPVVVTGAMRPSTVLSADGPLNLLNAILAAADRQSCGMGVLVCMDDRLLSARDAVKASTYRTDAFQCMEGGRLGAVIGSEVYYDYAPLRPHTAQSRFDVSGLSALPRVEIVYTHTGCGELLLRAALESRCRGVVVAGSGNGSVPPALRDLYHSWPGEKPVFVRASRVPGGRVGRNGGMPDEQYGSVASGAFSPQKARLLLQLALTQTSDIAEIRSIFASY